MNEFIGKWRNFIIEDKTPLRENFEVGDIVTFRGMEMGGDKMTVVGKRKMFAVKDDGRNLMAILVELPDGTTSEYDETQLTKIAVSDPNAATFDDDLNDLVDEFSGQIPPDEYVDDPSNPLGEPGSSDADDILDSVLDEELFTPNEMGDQAIEDESNSSAFQEGKGQDLADKYVAKLRQEFKNLSDDELDEFKKTLATAFDMNESINEDLRGLMAQGEKMAAFANKQSGYEGGVSSPVRGVLTAMTVAGAPNFDGDEELKAYWTRKLTKAIKTQMGKKYMSGMDEAASAKDIENQQIFNDELAKTAKLSKDAGLTENINPEIYKTVDRFIKAMAKRYGYEEKDAVFAIQAALKEREYNIDVFGDASVNEAELYSTEKKKLKDMAKSLKKSSKGHAAQAKYLTKLVKEGHSLEGKDLDLLKSLKNQIDQGVLNSKKKDAFVTLLNNLINTNISEGMSKAGLYSQIRDIIDSLDSGMSDGVPLDNETEMLLQQELQRLRKIYKSLKEGLPKGFWDKKIDAEDEDQDGKKDVKEFAYGDGSSDPFSSGEEAEGDYEEDIEESYATLVNKIKKSGKSKKAAKAIAGAVASYKAKGGGKGPTAKQK
jgi:hypothetical protein